MWEYSICVSSSNRQIANYILSASKKYVEKFGGVATMLADNNFLSIIIGIEDKLKEKAQNHICKVVTKTICSFFKSDFLDKNLALPIRDEISLLAFKKALINFDKETDFFIVSKSLSFKENLYLESFYNFRLKKLRDKWGELISLANDNRDYLISSDSFYDLLKFLVDNIDISEDEIDIVEDDDGYRIFSGNDDNSLECLSKEGLVSSVIDLSPQKINLYCKGENSATEILKRIYEKRVNLKFAKSEEKDLVKILKF